MGRLGPPSELAATIAFLWDHSSLTTGQVLTVDGGATITAPGMAPSDRNRTPSCLATSISRNLKGHRERPSYGGRAAQPTPTATCFHHHPIPSDHDG
ncbi:hypothetical protein I2456_00490 [Mycobacterium kubicae]|uniref:SDR family oxidoreductase n=1 Tax=Mycobacterium kubicae TaxID=120959 RepID=A0AAX1JCL4_9MYCO|nr:hypothetical protein [Mycobacterium kubicae]MCV7094285.1 hypothetical protein [Mycobacterium kubicae]QNI09912.1 SDR family oxidoreductase [Mycobacterium kubicae]QPI38108.1 hypothetical protein I2456_00490 [Mycobacterium kubicae]